MEGGRKGKKRGQRWDSNFGCGCGVGRHVFGEIAKRPGRDCGRAISGMDEMGLTGTVCAAIGLGDGGSVVESVSAPVCMMGQTKGSWTAKTRGAHQHSCPYSVPAYL